MWKDNEDEVLARKAHSTSAQEPSELGLRVTRKRREYGESGTIIRLKVKQPQPENERMLAGLLGESPVRKEDIVETCYGANEAYVFSPSCGGAA